MSDPTTGTPPDEKTKELTTAQSKPTTGTPSDEKTKELTTAQVAKLINAKPTDVLSFKDYGDRVVVVTIAGDKLTVDKNVKA